MPLERDDKFVRGHSFTILAEDVKAEAEKLKTLGELIIINSAQDEGDVLTSRMLSRLQTLDQNLHQLSEGAHELLQKFIDDFRG